MAKAKPTKVAEETGTEVVVAPQHTPAVGTAALPAYLQGYHGKTGAEDIRSEDITVPRLKIGQDMSPEVQEGGVARGDFFLNVSGEVVNQQGQRLPFVVIARNVEIILWRPKKDNGGGILARARAVPTPDGVRYAWDKPNQTFEVKVEGLVKATWKIGKYADEKTLDCGKDDNNETIYKSVTEWGSEIPGDMESKKAATDHHNYIVILPTYGNLVCALSLSRTATSKAKDFNATLKMGSAPLPARVFTVETFEAPVPNGGSGTYYNYKFRPAGFIADQAVYTRYQKMADDFADKVINVDQSDGGDEAEADQRA